MTNRIRIQNLLRLTLTRKGRAVAKHPLLREGVIEAIKAGEAETSDEPLWEAPEEEGDEDWYGDFQAFILTVPAEDIPASWEEAFASSELVEKAGGKKKNYPTSRGPFAGPHNSFPIKTQQDVYDAARLVGHAANPAAVKERIIRIAHSRGFQLPKSWRRGQTHTAKSGDLMDPKQFEELVATLSERLSSALAPADPAASEVTPEATPESVEKAKSSMHSHEHNHSTQRGYGYSHTHDHGHDAEDMANHETSESAHGHDHVSKADELSESVKADLAGLDADLKTRTDERDAARAELEAVKAELAEQAKVAEQVEAVKAELAAAVEAVKAPLIAASPKTAEKAEPDISKMSFDDALMAKLHS